MDRRLKIRHLQAFVEIVRQGSLKHAAERLDLTQPAISRTLAELEEILGASLLSRGRGRATLTERGELFHRFAQTSLAALEEGLATIGKPGTVVFRVGALPSVATRLMPEIAVDLTFAAPDMRLTIVDGSHDNLIDLLKQGELDLVLGRIGRPEAMRGLSFTQLYLEDVALVVRPGHPILADPDIRRIGNWTVIYPPPGAAIRPLVERLMTAENVAPPPKRIETVSGAFGRAFTRISDAIWIISTGVVAGDIAEGRLVRLPVATALTDDPIGLMERAGGGDNGGRRLFGQILAQVLARHGLG